MQTRIFLTFTVLLLAFTLVLSACNSKTPGAETQSTPIDSDTVGTSESLVYTVVRPDKCENELKNKATELYNYLKQGGKYDMSTDWYSDRDPSYNIPEYEILLGKTNRTESEQIFATLKHNDYYIGVVNKKLVIVGGSETATVQAIDYFISKYSFEGIKISEIEEYKYTVKSPVEKLTFGDVDYSECKIVYQYNDREWVLSLAKGFAQKLGELTGIAKEPEQVSEFTTEKGTIIFTAGKYINPTDVIYSAAEGVLTIKVGSPYISEEYGNILSDALLGGKERGTIVVSADITSNTVKMLKKTPSLSAGMDMRIAYFYEEFLAHTDGNDYNSSENVKVSVQRSQALMELLPDIVLFNGTDEHYFSPESLGYPLKHIYDFANVSSAIIYKKNTFNVSEPGQTVLMEYVKETLFGISFADEYCLNHILLENKNTKEKVLIISSDKVSDFNAISDRDKYQKCIDAMLSSLSNFKTEYGNIKIVISIDFGSEIPASDLTKITQSLGTPVSSGKDGYMLFCIGFDAVETVAVEDNSELVINGNKPYVADIK